MDAGNVAENVWVATNVLPAAPAGVSTAVSRAVNWDLFRNVPVFDMKNGRVEDVRSVLVRATLANSWHWIPVVGLPSGMAMANLDIFIRSHRYHLSKHPPQNLTEAQIRKLAICLGTLRAVCTTYYQLIPDDFVVGELGTAYVGAHSGPNGAPAFRIIEQSMEAVPAATPENPNPADPHRVYLTEDLELSTQEQAVIAELIKCGVGLLPMQGYSLVMCNHHYLSDPNGQSRKVYAAAEKAYWMSSTIGDWFTADQMLVQDACWHKAAHPVKMEYKIQRAMARNIKDLLVEAGAGACASRLPAVESEMRAAGSYKQLLATVEPMLAMCGGGIDYSALDAMIEIVRNYDSQLPIGAVNPLVPDQWRNEVVDRRTAVRKLGVLLESSQNVVAWCFGFYCAHVSKAALMGGSARRDSLRSSNSLSKLEEQYKASFVTGDLAYADYDATRTKARNEGVFKAPSFVLG